MTSRLDVRKQAAGIARAMGAPVEPCVYMGILEDSGVDANRLSIRFPIERGPFVAFDGYFRSQDGSVNFNQPILLNAGNRPITWERPQVFTSQFAAPPGTIVFPTAAGTGALGDGIYNLDGWPAPMFVRSGETVTVRRLTGAGDFNLAFAGFHTSLPAWRAIARELGEVRFWLIGDRHAVVTPPHRDECAAPEPVDVVNAYSIVGGIDTVLIDERTVHIENKRLAVGNRRLTGGANRFAQLLGIGTDSSPATCVGPRPLLANGCTSTTFDFNSVAGVSFPQIAFVGVASVDL